MTLKEFRPLLKRLKREAAQEAALRRDSAGACPKLKNIHPFPAKMGMDIVWDELKIAEAEAAK